MRILFLTPLMPSQAGVGIQKRAFQHLSMLSSIGDVTAKPVVRENARHSISTLGLDSILYLLGVRDRLYGGEQHLRRRSSRDLGRS